MSEVSDVLRDRMQTPGALAPMLTVSAAMHPGLAAALILASGGLLKRAADPSRTVISIDSADASFWFSVAAFLGLAAASAALLTKLAREYPRDGERKSNNRST